MKKLLVVMLILLFQPAYSASKVTLLLDWFANPDHAPIMVAQAQGFFTQEGLSVDIIGPADPSDPPKLIAAGKADIAIDYQPQLLEQIDQGLPLVQIGSLIDKPLNSLVVLEASGIHSPADLKNKKIGFSGSGVNNIFIKVMLNKHGLDLQDVQIINTHYDLTQALLSGKVDAVTGMMRNYEMLQMELAGRPGRAFFPEDNGMPVYSELIFIVNKDHQHDPRFSHFLTSVKRGYEYLNKHPEECWLAFAKAHPEADDELNHRAWIATLPYFAADPAQIDGNQLLHFASFMHDNGLIKNLQPLSHYAVIKE